MKSKYFKNGKYKITDRNNNSCYLSEKEIFKLFIKTLKNWLTRTK